MDLDDIIDYRVSTQHIPIKLSEYTISIWQTTAMHHFNIYDLVIDKGSVRLYEFCFNIEEEDLEFFKALQVDCYNHKKFECRVKDNQNGEMTAMQGCFIRQICQVYNAYRDIQKDMWQVIVVYSNSVVVNDIA